MSPSRIAYYLLAATLPPFMIGIIFTFVILKDLLIPAPPAPLPESAKASIPAPPSPSGRPVALIALGSLGVQSTEALAPAAVLGRSGHFDIVTAAQRRELVRGTSGIELYPHTTLADAPEPELLVIPSWIGDPDPAELASLQKLAEKARFVLAIGDGARILASAGYLAEKQATAHSAGRETLERSFPKVRWTWDRPAIIDGKWITSDGVFQSVTASMLALRTAAGEKLQTQVAREIGWREEDSREMPADGGVRWSDWIPMLLHGGYGWGRHSGGIVLSDGVDELELAVAADPSPRTLSERTVILAAERRIYRTAQGILLAPNIPADKAPPLDSLTVPRSLAAAAPPAIPVQASANVRLPGGFSDNLKFTFDRLGENEGAWITSFVARMTRYHWKDGSPFSGRVPHLLLRVLLVSLFGVTLAWFLDRRVRLRYGMRRESPQVP